MIRALAFAPLALLAACGSADDSDGLSGDQRRDLNEAAATIDANASVNVTEVDAQ